MTRPLQEEEGMVVATIGVVEESMQQDFTGAEAGVGNMCEGWAEEVRPGIVGMGYDGELAWDKLDPHLLEKGGGMSSWRGSR